MKVLLVIKSLSTAAGGAERVLSIVSNALASRGHDVRVLSFDRQNVRDYYSVGVKVSRIRLGVGETTQPSNPVELIRRIRRLREYTSAHRPDVALGFMHSSFVPLAIALMGSKIPVIGCERTAYQHYLGRPLDRFLVRATLPLLHCLTANNDAVRRGYPAAIARRMIIIPNPVIRAKRFSSTARKGRKILLTVGRLEPEKDQSTLIYAFARIAPRFPDWCLRIVGHGPLMDRLRAEAKLLGVAPVVQLPGVVENVADEYRRAQLFALPSVYESFPNGLAEALAHGLPAVGFAYCPGTNDLIANGVNGLLASDGDRVTELARALEELMSAPERRRQMAAAAVESVKPYGLQSVIDKWEQLLRSAVRR